MRYLKVLGPFLLGTALTACLTVEAVSVSQIPAEKDRNHRISASASRPIVFLIPFGTSYVEEARKGLLDRCPGGAIEGVLAKFQSTDYFLGLVLVKEVSMSGYCLNPAKKG